ncbi:hypothetical protein [Glycomyces salinus]|nr:hypothetical protein [Glycomyces salinus]
MDDPDRPKSVIHSAGCFVGGLLVVLIVAGLIFLLFIWDLDFSGWEY